MYGDKPRARWADEYGPIFPYDPISEITALLHQPDKKTAGMDEILILVRTEPFFL